MCICLYVCVYKYAGHVSMCIFVCVCTYLCIYVFILSMYVCICLHVCMYVYMYVRMQAVYACVYIYLCLCVCVHMFLSEYTTIIPLNRINIFGFVMKIKCVFSKIEYDFNTTQMQYSFTR